MEDDMEDENLSELDVDYLQFKQNQLAIFKHDFRERASRAVDDSHQNAFRLGFNKSIPLARKLGRLKGTLSALKTFHPVGDDVVDSVISKCEYLLDRLATIKLDFNADVPDSGEFTLDFAKKKLPDYNADDIDLLFGDISLVSNETNECATRTNENDTNRVELLFNEIEKESNVLFEKCCPILHSYQVIIADLRNHGDSPHTTSMSYEEMAADLEYMWPEWSQGFNKCILLGHSLGGKVASYLALDKPHLIDKLILEDIVPKTYHMSRYVDLGHFVRSMRNSVWKSNTASEARREVDKQLSSVVEDLATRQFLLTNLVERNGKVVWKLNLDGIEGVIPLLFSFPEHILTKQYTGPTFVVWGENTIHLNPQIDTPYLKRLFPSMKITMIPNAGHWIHSQKPKEFMDAVVQFLTNEQ